MKNIYILPTDKPSRLHFTEFEEELVFTRQYEKIDGVNIYITSDEEIKDGDYIINIESLGIFQHHYKDGSLRKQLRKIILTTDQDLIKEGIQSIDDEFLEWFVKNPSCESVGVVYNLKYFNVDELRERHLKSLPHLYSEKIGYKIIIPKEEVKQKDEKGNPITYWGGLEKSKQENDYSALLQPVGTKQETLEEVAIENRIRGINVDTGFKQETLKEAKAKLFRYSEEEVKDIVNQTIDKFYKHTYSDKTKAEMKVLWFEQFKKK